MGNTFGGVKSIQPQLFNDFPSESLKWSCVYKFRTRKVEKNCIQSKRLFFLIGETKVRISVKKVNYFQPTSTVFLSNNIKVNTGVYKWLKAIPLWQISFKKMIGNISLTHISWHKNGKNHGNSFGHFSLTKKIFEHCF